MVRSFKSFGRDADGATSIEYSLIVALMAVAVIAALIVIGPSLKNGLVKIGSDMSSPKDVTLG